MGVMNRFFKEGEDGFTTAGSAVAILLAVVLAFGAVQAHWSQSKAGQIQYVADAAALAADGAVAEFVVYAQTIDAALLTLSLIAIASYAASAVAAFIPGAEGAAASLAEFGSKVFTARDSFAESATKGLNAVQAALPALCTLRAMEVTSANGQVSGVGYQCVAVPLPTTADDIEIPDDSEAEKAGQEIEDMESEVEEQVDRQEQAQKELDEAKQAAWEADCGGEPSMRERAQTLAGLTGSANPDYASVETWSFSVSLERAKSYYSARIQQENPSSYSQNPELAGESVARKAFYEYALATVSKGSVGVDDQGNESPDLKYLARNVEQIKSTYLYTQANYPVSSDGGSKTLHAYTGCPQYEKESPSGTGSVAQVDSGVLKMCPSCKFSATTLGRVPSASTSINNGFEYHYRKVVDAAQDYKKAAKELSESTKKLKEDAQSMQDLFRGALESLSGTRINIQPPGRYGCICVVTAGESSLGIGASFIGEPAKVGARVAISAATLAEDPEVDMSQVLGSVGSKLVPSESLTGTIAKTVFGAWGSALEAYAQGAEGIQSIIDGVIGSVPVVGTDLSEWVSAGFSSAAEAAGLQPAEVKAYKPVVVATKSVLAADSSGFASALLSAHQAAESVSEITASDLYQALSILSALSADGLSFDDAGNLVLATLSLAASGLGAGEKSLTIESAADLLQQYASALSGVRGSL